MKANLEGRQSGIELLKIIAILLIVLNHVIQTLTETNGLFPDSSYVIDITSNTTNLQTLALAILRNSGCIGNDIFVVCSAWFLLGSTFCDKKKVSFLVCDVWVVSVLIFVVTFVLGTDLSRDETLVQFFPTSNSNNWFITCYILFFLIHPLLNKLIKWMEQRRLLLTCCIMVLLYAIINFFRPWFFSYAPFYMNDLIVWIMIYFVLAYVRFYMTDFQKNTKANVICLLIGIFGQAFMTFAANLAGLLTPMLANRVIYFNYGGSPFIILLAISALNLARNCHFRSSFVNYVSGLSLLIYIIHENWILRYYFRPYIFRYIYGKFGYGHILLWVLLITLGIFVLAALVSAAYKETLERPVRKLSVLVYNLASRIYHALERRLLKLH